MLEMALRAALENDEFHLLYQPVVQAGTGALMGFEALLRWTHLEYGNISPAKFVPLAEEAGLIAPIGEWVLRNACIKAARWDHPIRIAINVSPEKLHNPAFVAFVSGALQESGLRPERLDLGVHLSLDDFGTGYSSLGYFSRTRFSSIKVDRSFVQGASKGSKQAIAIIRAVVALAESLGMKTTTEGVETEDEHRMIQALSCTKVQGYYFGGPLPVNEAQ